MSPQAPLHPPPQALLCYLPHFLWKSWEGGKLAMLLQVPQATKGFLKYVACVQGLDQQTMDGDEEGTRCRRTKVGTCTCICTCNSRW